MPTSAVPTSATAPPRGGTASGPVPTASGAPTPGTRATGWGALRHALGRGPARHRAAGRAATACYAAGGLLLVWTAAVHFHLWAETDGYRTIPTIGPLFLLQSIAGIVIGVGVVVLRRVWAAAVGAGFALATLAGFLVSVSRGLFGFQDSWLAPYAKEAFAVEVAAAALLIAAAVLCLWAPVRAGTGSSPAGGTT